MVKSMINAFDMKFCFVIILLLQNTEFLRLFSIYLIHFSGQVRKYFTCPAEVFTCPGQPDNRYVRPCINLTMGGYWAVK